MNIKNEQNNIENLIKEFRKNILSNKAVCICIILNVILVLVIICMIFVNDNVILEDIDIQNTENNIQEIEAVREIEESKIKIKVHITGEVKNSGIYELDEDSRISDVIEIAGGITSEADLTKVNLAYQVLDGQKIIIPSIMGENDGNYIIENSGENIIQEETNLKDLKINVNTATVSELMTLQGVGKSTAEKIINYREENGKFKNIEDIKNVSGIGESKYNQLKDYIKVK